MKFRRGISRAMACSLAIAAVFIVARQGGDKAISQPGGVVPSIEEPRAASESQKAEAASATRPWSSGSNAASSRAEVTLADWDLYPAGLMAAADQALRHEDGKQAYEIVRIMDACEGLPARLEGTRQNLADLQTQGVVKPRDRHLVGALLASMQRDLAHCQALDGDLKGLRRHLLAVAVRAGVEGSGVALLLSGVEEPWVTSQVLREAESGDGMALRMLASGDIPQAKPLQRDAARDALVRGAKDPDLRSDASVRVQQHLAAVERHAAVEDWRADPGHAAKAAVADSAYVGKGAPQLKASADPQVHALADQYLLALKRRLIAQGS